MTDPQSSIERYCLTCRYSLRGNATLKCPECGRSFDPDNPRTFANTARRWSGPGMRGDLVLVATVAAYAAVNIALNGMFARGMLGRAPLGLMATLVFASALGAFASLALFLMAKPVWMTWRGTLCAAVLLGLLTWFNAVCLRDAATAAA